MASLSPQTPPDGSGEEWAQARAGATVLATTAAPAQASPPRASRQSRHCTPRARQRSNLTLDPAQPVEVDGDVLDPATRLRFSIDPDALIVRVLSTGPE